LNLPNKVRELIKKLPKEHSGLKKLIEKNYQRMNFDKLKTFRKTQVENFYKQVIEQILLSNPEALELLKNLSVINTEVDTNIDRKGIETSYELPNIEKAFNVLLDTGIIKKKKGTEEIYDFSYNLIQGVLEIMTDEKCHEKAISYYERKRKKYGENLNDDIELLFHKVKLSPTEDLVNEFFAIVNLIEQFDYKYKRLIDVAGELIILGDKYKAPILIVLGDMFSVIGMTENAERIYRDALNTYKKLAKQYYRIFLPYVAATQKNLGTLYTDLKRFEEAEKIFLDALKVYKELEKQYYDVYTPDLDLTQSDLVDMYIDENESKDQDKSYLDVLKTYSKLVNQYYDIYFPNETAISNYFGNVGVDLSLFEDIKDGTIDSIDSYKALAKICYDMYLNDVATTQSNLGIIYSELMKFEEAERMHLEALKIKKKLAELNPSQVLPSLALTLIDLGDLYANLNKFEDAEPMYSEALKISKQLAEQNPEVYFYNVAIINNCLGNVYVKLQKFEEAQKMYLDALKIFKIFAKEDPKAYLYNVADVQNNLGNLFMILKNLEKAEYYLNKAFKKDPANVEILYNIACLESLRNNQVKALELLTQVIELDKKYIERTLLDDRFDNIKDSKEFKELIGE